METLHGVPPSTEASPCIYVQKADSHSVRIRFKDPNTLRSLIHFDDTDDTGSGPDLPDLSDLDEELNEALHNPTFMVKLNYRKKLPALSSVPSSSARKAKKPTPTMYKSVPKNIVPIIEHEMSQVDCDDDFGVVEKVVFSLKDPLSASRIKIPVKSNRCIHFECFDFDTFCMFNKIPQGVLNLTKKDMSKRSYQRLANHHEAVAKEHKNRKAPQQQLKHEFITIIDDPTPIFRHSLPTYKCPLCDLDFVLAELYFSNLLNYFVKTIPSNIDKVELLECNSYRPIEDSKIPTSSSTESDGDHLVILSSDDELDSKIKHEATSQKNNDQNDDTLADDTDNLLDDGLDELFLSLGSHNHAAFDSGASRHFDTNPQNSEEVEFGSGSWNDPVTLD